ncbi:MAG: ferritin [Planctomycetes bacterium RBG_13_60_9]|nr:MAG: ferritin [Planctomycetes bacterium RBG_13_60_9]
MISAKVEKALNEQINEELYSSYLYLSMAAWFESQNLPGFASWMRVQVREENTHAMKFVEFINERRGRVALQAIKEPTKEWESPLAAFEAALKHEQHITGRINELVNLAVAEKDHATGAFLQWFVNEQVEEEAAADSVVQKLTIAKDAPGALLMLDHAMGERK